MYDRRSQQRQPRCKCCQASGSPVLGDWPCAQAERLNAGSAPAQCRTDQSVVDRSHISNTVSSSQHIPNCCVGPTPRDHEELGGPSVPWDVGLDLRVRRSLWERVPASRPACSAGLPSWAWTPTSHAAEPARDETLPGCLAKALLRTHPPARDRLLKSRSRSSCVLAGTSSQLV